MLPLAEATRIALAIRKQLEAEHRTRHAVQSSGKRDIASAKRGGCDHRIILLVIGTDRGVAVIVGCWQGSSAATCIQCDSEAGVVVHGVTQNGPFRVIAGESCDADAVESVKRDDVAFPRSHAPDRPDGRIAGGDAAVSVSQGRRSGDVGANLVALDHHAVRSAAYFYSVGTRVDHIARARCAATDGGVE